MSIQRLIKSVVESVVSISFAIFLKNSLGLIWGFAIGYICSNLVMIFINYKNFKNLKYSKVILKTVSKKYINFPKYTLPHSLLNTLSSQIPIYVIPFFFSSNELGYYSFGLRMVQTPLSLISQSFFNVIGQKFAEEHANGKSLLPLFKSTLKKLSLLAIATIPFFIFAPEIFGFVFGERWIEAGKYIRILSPWIILIFILSPLANIPVIFNRQKKAFIIEIVNITSRCLVLIVGGYLLDIKITLLIFSLTNSAIIFYNFTWYYNLVKNQEEINA